MTLNRRHFLTASAAALGQRIAGAAGKRPNILILFTDDQRFSTVNASTTPR